MPSNPSRVIASSGTRPVRRADVAPAKESSDETPPWPSSPLDAAQRAFDLLVHPPAPLAFDCRGFDGLPDRLVALDELKQLLITDAVPYETRDGVWRELITRARRDGPAWIVACVGIALPGIRRRAGRMSYGWHGDTNDLDSEMLLGFLERLRSIDLTGIKLCAHLIDAGASQVRRSRRHSEDTSVIHTDGARSLPPARPWDHPDFVLARAVAAAVIGPEEGRIIAQTRLENVPLTEVARELGVAVTTVGAWRRRAERLLQLAIQAGELRWLDLPTP